jgi:hypothetical protein
LQQGLQTEAEETSQLQERHVERKDFVSRRKLENLKKAMQKNAVSVLGVDEVRWKGQGEIRSGDYTVDYSGGDG